MDRRLTFSGFPLLISWPALVYNSSTKLQLNTGTNVFPIPLPLTSSDIIHFFYLERSRQKTEMLVACCLLCWFYVHWYIITKQIPHLTIINTFLYFAELRKNSLSFN